MTIYANEIIGSVLYEAHPGWGVSPDLTNLRRFDVDQNPDNGYQITYSFMESIPSYFDGFGIQGFEQLNSDVKSAIDAILNNIDINTNIDFIKVDESAQQYGTMRFGMYVTRNGVPSGSANTAEAFPPGTFSEIEGNGDGQLSGDVFITQELLDRGVQGGQGGYAVLVHEILHGLGLSHPMGLSSTYDNAKYTVMSYNGSYTFTTPAPIDVQALHYLYGIPEGQSADTWIGASSSTKPKALAYEGTSGDDTQSGTILNDKLYGLAGNDTLTGGAGNDLLDGGEGNDTLTGNDGNDKIYGGEGNNVIAAGEGKSQVTAGAGDDSVTAGSGNDKILGGDGENHIDAGEGNNQVITGAGDDSITAGSGNDKIFAGDGENQINAGEGNNQVTSGIGDDTINSGFGNDKITAGDGNNDIHAGDGNNRVTSGIGADTIETGNGNDKIVAGDGDNMVSAGEGNDSVVCGSGNDVIDAGSGNDKVAAGDGADRINGGAGANKLTGGLGADTFVLSNLDPGVFDTVSDFTEEDILSFDTSVFTALSGMTENGFYILGSVDLSDAQDFLIFNAAKGILYYDANGDDGIAGIDADAMAVAVLKGGDAKTLAFDDLNFF